MEPSVTNTMVNGTIIDGSQLDQNFDDIINALSDGTKDINVKNFECLAISTDNMTARTSLNSDTIITTSISSTTSTITSVASSRVNLSELETYTIDIAKTITPSFSFIELDSTIETDLETIGTGLGVGSIITLVMGISMVSVTIKNVVGNIVCGGDLVMTDFSIASFILIGVNWCLLSYSGNV